MTEKIPVTVLLTKTQADKLRAEAKRTGNSQNSIVRTSLEKYFNFKEGTTYAD